MDLLRWSIRLAVSRTFICYASAGIGAIITAAMLVRLSIRHLFTCHGQIISISLLSFRAYGLSGL